MTPAEPAQPARLSDSEIAEIKVRVDAATPGPWAVKFGTYAVHQPEFECWIPQDENDAAFIAAARTDIPRLLAEVAQIRREDWELAKEMSK